MVLGLDGPQGSTLLTHGGDGGVTLINVGEEKVASQYRGVLLCITYAGLTMSVGVVRVFPAARNTYHDMVMVLL